MGSKGVHVWQGKPFDDVETTTAIIPLFNYVARAGRRHFLLCSYSVLITLPKVIQ